MYRTLVDRRTREERRNVVSFPRDTLLVPLTAKMESNIVRLRLWPERLNNKSFVPPFFNERRGGINNINGHH